VPVELREEDGAAMASGVGRIEEAEFGSCAAKEERTS
jgi:hypothetical protein